MPLLCNVLKNDGLSQADGEKNRGYCGDNGAIEMEFLKQMGFLYDKSFLSWPNMPKNNKLMKYTIYSNASTGRMDQLE